MLGDEEPLGDVVGREMLVEQEQHLDLACRQRAGDVVGNAAADPAAAAQLIEQAPGDFAGQRSLAVGDAAEERDDPLRRLALQEVAGCSGANRREQVFLGAGGRQDDDLAAGSRGAQPRQGRQPVEAGHREIEQDEVGLQLGGELERLSATDHPWLLSIIAGACASAGANIVDAQIYTTTDGRALDTIAISREYDRDEDEGRRATRIGEMIEQVLEGKLRLPDVVARKAANRGKVRAFVVEPEVTINNQWSDRYTVIEVSGLDRPGLLYQLTTAISKLNLNIASAHVATFGERARDVFYVTDLLGAQINAPTRQAAIKSALIHLLSTEDNVAQPAA